MRQGSCFNIGSQACVCTIWWRPSGWVSTSLKILYGESSNWFTLFCSIYLDVVHFTFCCGALHFKGLGKRCSEILEVCISKLFMFVCDFNLIYMFTYNYRSIFANLSLFVLDCMVFLDVKKEIRLRSFIIKQKVVIENIFPDSLSSSARYI